MTSRFRLRVFLLAITLSFTDICQLWPGWGNVLIGGASTDPIFAVLKGNADVRGIGTGAKCFEDEL